MLHVASWGYGGGVALRNRRYDRDPSQVHRLAAPVISIGNLTTGGTGKTPLVIDVAERLDRLGRRPAVVSRGYRARGGSEPDEMLVVRRHCGNVVTVADADRVAGARTALDLGADVIVLDDAFQHRRIHRNLDLVVIDATCPFGYGHLLPRGLLREPPSALRRANAVILSRADAVEASSLDAVQRRIRQIHSDAPFLRCRHLPTHLVGLNAAKLDLSGIRETRVLAAAGIGNHSAFERSLIGLGAVVVGTLALPDHAAFDRAQFMRIRDAATRADGAAMLVITEKDWVKLDPELWGKFPLPVFALAVKIQFLDQGGDELDRMLSSALISPGSE